MKEPIIKSHRSNLLYLRKQGRENKLNIFAEEKRGISLGIGTIEKLCLYCIVNILIRKSGFDLTVNCNHILCF